MPIDREDVQKLHSESNQIVNQRFVLNTTAVTFFGIANGWILQDPSKISDTEIYLLLPLTLTVYYILYLYSVYLRYILRNFTTYLKVRHQSPWETDWKNFRDANLGYFSYSRAEKYLFTFLGCATGLANIIAPYLPAGPKASGFGILLFVVVVLGIYAAFVFTEFPLCWLAKEDDLEGSWKKVIGPISDNLAFKASGQTAKGLPTNSKVVDSSPLSQAK